MGESMFAFIFALGLFSTDLLADRKLTDVKYQPPDYKAQQGKEIAVTPDGGFVFLASVSDEDDPALVVKFDSSGKKEWETTLPDISPGIGSLAVSKEGSIYVAGNSANAQLCGSRGLKSDFIKTCSKISKLDSNGELEWEKTIQDPNYSMYIYSVGLLPNGSIVGVGSRSGRVELLRVGRERLHVTVVGWQRLGIQLVERLVGRRLGRLGRLGVLGRRRRRDLQAVAHGGADALQADFERLAREKRELEQIGRAHV